MGHLRCAAAILMLEFFLSVSRAQTSYSVTDLGTLDGSDSSYANAINASGQVAGSSTPPGGHGHAFLWSSGSGIQDLGTVGGDYSWAYGINASGQVVGQSLVGFNSAHAFLWSDGMMQDLGTFAGGGYVYAEHSVAYGINEVGQVAGWSTPRGHAFLWSGGVMQDLGALPGYGYSTGYALNDFGQVVGDSPINGFGAWHAFLWSGGAMQDLGTLGGYRSSATGINNAGQVVGWSWVGGDSNSAPSHAVLWSGTGMQDLGTLGGSSSAAKGINGSGQIVGSSSINGDSASHAFVYHGATMRDLNTHVDASSTGWTLESANGINDAGQIVGTGINPQGQTRGFLLTPNRPPEPPPTMYAILAGANDGGARGDLDAQGIRSALLQFPGTKPENVILATSKEQFTSTMTAVTAAIRPGDSLIVFYSGHGFYFNNGSHPEPAVPNGPLAAIATTNLYNDGEDALGLDEAVSDDELTAMLSSDSKLAQVKKAVWLDSCFSGGFWGQADNQADEGDFDKLENIGLITSAGEGGLSFSYPSYAQNAGRGFFSVALESVLNDLAEDDASLSFSSIMLGLTARYVNSNYPDSGAIRAFPWLDSEVIVSVDEMLGPISAISADFDQNGSLIPEPSALSLLLSASVLLTRSRRRRC